MSKTLPLLVLLLSLGAFAQTAILAHAGQCSTSTATDFYCVAISVSGVGTPGYTWASIWVPKAAGDFDTTSGAFLAIGDDCTVVNGICTGQTILLQGLGFSGTVTYSTNPTTGLPDANIVGSEVGATTNVNITYTKRWNRSHSAFTYLPIGDGGKVVLH